MSEKIIISGDNKPTITIENFVVLGVEGANIYSKCKSIVTYYQKKQGNLQELLGKTKDGVKLTKEQQSMLSYIKENEEALSAFNLLLEVDSKLKTRGSTLKEKERKELQDKSLDLTSKLQQLLILEALKTNKDFTFDNLLEESEESEKVNSFTFQTVKEFLEYKKIDVDYISYMDKGQADSIITNILLDTNNRMETQNFTSTPSTSG